jgi:hypothetical protein
VSERRMARTCSQWVGGVVDNENERIGKSESIGGVLSDCVYMGE